MNTRPQYFIVIGTLAFAGLLSLVSIIPIADRQSPTDTAAQDDLFQRMLIKHSETVASFQRYGAFASPEYLQTLNKNLRVQATQADLLDKSTLGNETHDLTQKWQDAIAEYVYERGSASQQLQALQDKLVAMHGALNDLSIKPMGRERALQETRSTILNVSVLLSQILEPDNGPTVKALRSSLKPFPDLLSALKKGARSPEQPTLTRVDGLARQIANEGLEFLETENTRRAALARVFTAQDTLGKKLRAYHPGAYTSAPETRSKAWAILCMLLCWTAAMGLVYLWRRRETKQGGLSDEAKAIRLTVESAITGDLSRKLNPTDVGELAPLADSVNRLLYVVRRSEQLIYQLASLVESAGDGIIGLNLDGSILSWNASAQKIYGYSAGEVRGISFLELMSPEGREEFLDVLGRAQRGDLILPFEAHHLKKNGESLQICIHVSPIMDTTARIIGVSILVRNLSSQKRLEQERDDLLARVYPSKAA